MSSRPVTFINMTMTSLPFRPRPAAVLRLREFS